MRRFNSAIRDKCNKQNLKSGCYLLISNNRLFYRQYNDPKPSAGIRLLFKSFYLIKYITI